MDKMNIEGVLVTNLKKIHNPKGNIFHCMKNDDQGYKGFGEAYFSTINHDEIKGWNKHKLMTLNLVVPIGEVAFVLYDDRVNSKAKCKYFKSILSEENYQRLTVPPGLWIAFKGCSNLKNLILNIADIKHDKGEIERLNLNEIPFNWKEL